MGVSTDAILAFGFDLGDDEDRSIAEVFNAPEGDDDGFDFDEWVGQKAGAIYPEGHAGIDSPEYVAYSTKKREAVDSCPVELITHCSYDYPMYFLAIRGTEVRAWRGEPKPIHIERPAQAKIDAMKLFCEQNGVEWQEPAWHIFSLWG